jgi:hypothetical protein
VNFVSAGSDPHDHALTHFIIVIYAWFDTTQVGLLKGIAALSHGVQAQRPTRRYHNRYHLSRQFGADMRLRFGVGADPGNEGTAARSTLFIMSTASPAHAIAVSKSPSRVAG